VHQVVERQRSGPNGDNRNRQGGPGKVEICPALRNDKLNDASHDEESSSAQARCQSDDEQDGERDLGNRIDECDNVRRGKFVCRTENMQLEFIFE
jgi:hypothetical protein